MPFNPVLRVSEADAASSTPLTMGGDLPFCFIALDEDKWCYLNPEGSVVDVNDGVADVLTWALSRGGWICQDITPDRKNRQEDNGIVYTSKEKFHKERDDRGRTQMVSDGVGLSFVSWRSVLERWVPDEEERKAMLWDMPGRMEPFTRVIEGGDRIRGYRFKRVVDIDREKITANKVRAAFSNKGQHHQTDEKRFGTMRPDLRNIDWR